MNIFLKRPQLRLKCQCRKLKNIIFEKSKKSHFFVKIQNVGQKSIFFIKNRSLAQKFISIFECFLNILIFFCAKVKIWFKKIYRCDLPRITNFGCDSSKDFCNSCWLFLTFFLTFFEYLIDFFWFFFRLF